MRSRERWSACSAVHMALGRSARNQRKQFGIGMRRRAEEPRPEHPKEWLAPPLKLFARAKQTRYMSEFGGSPITTTPEEDQDIRQLNDLRRGFAHYTPRLWNVEVAGLPRIVLNTVRVIERLLAHPALSFRLKEEQSARARNSIGKLRDELLQHHESDTVPGS